MCANKTQNNEQTVEGKPNSSQQVTFWQQYKIPVMLTVVGGAIDTIGFVGLFGFFTNHVTGNLVMAGAGIVQGGSGLWIKLGAVPVFILTVIVTKRVIEKRKANKLILSDLLFAEVAFLLAFFLSAIYFGPFDQPGTLEIAFTGFLGLIAFAIRNTASKTVMGKMSSTLLMTGNTTQLGIDLSDYIFDRNNCNFVSLKHSFTIVASFAVGALIGALLYIQIGLWAIGPFILPVLMAAIATRDEQTLRQATRT
ncbi:Predicted membrane protein [Psychrobacter phenylpyruvicus]|uniref:Predicted membrane protein n=2 Tax=Psychrobacter phenylpyruvicus TaxID=29432 RepID=A0A379LN03_9GAMM|nr:Predicted membrane protein [Psychrobacter phenylpyruvicus]